MSQMNHKVQEMLMGQGYGHIPPPPSMNNLQGYAAINEADGKSFGQTFGSMISKVNDQMSEPERLTIEAVTTGNVDIHEVMIAMGKSEVAFKMLSSVSQKVISGFDKLSNMQV